ncbi:acetate--CoA ligase family protein, partial [Patescibacteria group bacterium]
INGMSTDLSTLLCPKSVAVIGASRTPEKVGAVILKNILNSDFPGTIFPINPKVESLEGLKCYPSINDLPETPELAIVAIPSELVLDTLEQLGNKGTRNVVVITAGFKEIGAEGEKLENQLIEIAKKYEINMLGPNCMGFVNNDCPINATFGQSVKTKGNIRFLSQSGAIASSVFDWIETSQLGFNEFITLGNKAQISEVEVLEYFHNKPMDVLSEAENKGLSKVKPIGMYLESITNGSKFLQIAQKITKKDPIFVLKPGKTEAAAKAMQSHTGAIAGEDDVLDAVLKQAGVLRCDTLEDFFDMSRAFSWEDIPQGPKVAIVSNAGGPSVISADAVIKEGLELTKFGEDTNTQLRDILPRSASIINPVDVLGDALAKRFSQASEIILEKEEVDALLFIVTPQLMTQIKETAEVIGFLSNKYNKPIFCSFIGGNLVSEGEKVLNEYKIPSFRYPERAIKAVGAMWKWKKSTEKEEKQENEPEITINQDETTVRPILQEAINNKHKTLDNVAANEILKAAGIKTPPTKNAENLEDAKSFAKENGWPVVLKLSSPGLLHKNDVGGVITDIMTEKALDDAWYRLGKKIEELNDEELKKHVRFQVQKQVLQGVEVIIGVKHDPTFGTVLLFGAGGSFAELISDRNLHLLPINYSMAKNLVENSKVFSVLNKHYKNGPKYALDKLYELI